MTQPAHVIEIVSLTRVFGGGEVFIGRLVKLLQSRFAFRVISPALAPLAELLARHSVPALWLPASGALRAHAALAWHLLQSAVSGRRPSLAVLNGRGAAYWAPAYRLLDVPVVLIRHTELQGGLGEAVYRLCARYASDIIAVSHTVASQHTGALIPKVQVIYNWFDGHVAMSCATAAASRPLSLKFVGRLVAEKGLGAVVDAIRALHDVRLDVYGDGPLRDWVVQAASSEGKVAWHGFVENVQDRLAEPGLVICPSFSEAFSLVLVEATLAGNVCLASDISTHREILPDDYPGELFFAPGDSSAVASSIRFAQQLIDQGPDRVDAVWRHAADHLVTLTDPAKAASAYARTFARYVRPFTDEVAAPPSDR